MQKGIFRYWLPGVNRLSPMVPLVTKCVCFASFSTHFLPHPSPFEHWEELLSKDHLKVHRKWGEFLFFRRQTSTDRRDRLDGILFWLRIGSKLYACCGKV